MSFAKGDPTAWLGRTYDTAELITAQAASVVAGLNRIEAHLRRLAAEALKST
jgi:hypothetical protein